MRFHLRDLPTHYHVTVDIPIAWGEMDALGHVNNTVYFRYFEAGGTFWSSSPSWLCVQNQVNSLKGT